MEEWKGSAVKLEEETASTPVAEAAEETVSTSVAEAVEEVIPMPAEDGSAEDAAAVLAEERRAKWKEIKSNILFFGISFIVIYLVFYVFPPYLVSGDSMNKTLTDKAFGFGIRFCDLKKGDIIVFSNSKTRGDDYIKRVIACPGDTIEIINNEVYVNGKLVDEDYAYYDQALSGDTFILDGNGNKIPRYHLEEITLGDDEYFVMGDNRNHSTDSRRIGVVRKEDVKCKMLFFIWGKH